MRIATRLVKYVEKFVAGMVNDTIAGELLLSRQEPGRKRRFGLSHQSSSHSLDVHERASRLPYQQIQDRTEDIG